jgi:hypothetical protein
LSGFSIASAQRVHAASKQTGTVLIEVSCAGTVHHTIDRMVSEHWRAYTEYEIRNVICHGPVALLLDELCQRAPCYLHACCTIHLRQSLSDICRDSRRSPRSKFAYIWRNPNANCARLKPCDQTLDSRTTSQRRFSQLAASLHAGKEVPTQHNNKRNIEPKLMANCSNMYRS